MTCPTFNGASSPALPSIILFPVFSIATLGHTAIVTIRTCCSLCIANASFLLFLEDFYLHFNVQHKSHHLWEVFPDFTLLWVPGNRQA